MHEKDPAEAQPTAQELQGLSPQEIQALIDAGMLDAAQLEAQGLIDPAQAGFEATNPYGVPEQSPDAEKQAAEALLVNAETKALNAARTGEASGVSAFFAAEKAAKDRDVADARHQIEDIFGSSEATRIEQAAMAEAIDTSALPSTNKEEIAAASVSGRSPVAELDHAAPGTDKAEIEKYGALKDKVNGRAGKIVDDLSKRTREDLKRLGINGTVLQTLGAEAVRGGGAELTQTDVADAVEAEVIGDQVVRSIVGNKPRMSKKLREQLRDMSSHPGELINLARAAATVRGGGRLSAGTKRTVGKRFVHSQQHNKAA